MEVSAGFMDTWDPERADISFSWKSFLYLKTHFYLRISCWTFSISSICPMPYPCRRDPLGIVKHTIYFSAKSSSRKSFDYGSIPPPCLNVRQELRYSYQTWPSYCLCSVDSFAFGGTLKKGLVCLVLCFSKGKDVTELSLWSVFFRAYLSNFQRVSLSLRAYRRGGENWVRGMSLLYLPSNLLHKT